MSSTLSRRAPLPQLSSRWTTPDTATAQGDRKDGAQAARGEADAGALDRFWRRIATDAGSDLLRFYSECGRMLDDHNAKLERLRHELDVDLVNLSNANQRQHDERMATLKRETGPDSALYKERAARLEDAQKALRTVRAEVNSRPLRTQFGLFYYVMMPLLALAEIPVNRAAFELTFREEPVFSLMLAAAVGLILIFFAHVIGLMLRQWPRRPSVAQVAARVGAMLLILTGVGGGVYFMAKMRQGFMRLTTSEAEGFSDRLQEALRGGTPSTVAVMVDVPLSVSDWTFIALNVLIFMFGVVASFLRHDPHPDYARAMRDTTKSGRAFGKIEKKYAGVTQEEMARYEDRKRSLEGQMGELRSAIAALADQTASIGEHWVSARRMVAQTILKRCGSFADGFAAATPSRPLDSPPQETILDVLPAMDRPYAH